MNIIQTPIDGLLVIEPQVFQDARGYFVETYNEKRYREAGIDTVFVQDNQSKSKKGVVRVCKKFFKIAYPPASWLSRRGSGREK